VLPFSLALVLAAGARCESPKPGEKIVVKVVVVAMFEVGADTGDQPASCSTGWSGIISTRSIRCRRRITMRAVNDDGELAIVTGQGTAHAAATIMALGLDPRFDLTHAYC